MVQPNSLNTFSLRENNFPWNHFTLGIDFPLNQMQPKLKWLTHNVRVIVVGTKRRYCCEWERVRIERKTRRCTFANFCFGRNWGFRSWDRTWECLKYVCNHKGDLSLGLIWDFFFFFVSVCVCLVSKNKKIWYINLCFFFFFFSN